MLNPLLLDGWSVLCRFSSARRVSLVTAVLAVLSPACVTHTSVAVLPTSSGNCRLESIAEVAWLGPESARDRALHDRWCAAVESPVITHQDDASDLRAASYISTPPAIVSWNMEVGEGKLIPLVTALRRGDFTGGTPVGHFVLLLQEVYRTDERLKQAPAGSGPPRAIGGYSSEGDIVKLANTLGLELFYAPAMRNGRKDEDRGNAILSTLPLTDLVVIELPFERQRRIALLATVGTAGSRQLRVATVHLETRAGLTRRGPAAARLRQVEALAAVTSGSGLPVILAGDLNTSWGDDEPAVRTLRTVFPNAGRTPGTTWSKGIMSAKLDHFFARLPEGWLNVRKLPSRFGSDHYPIMAVIEASRQN